MPTPDTTPPPVPSPAPLLVDWSQYPVLVVDDEPDNLDIFRFNFRKSHPLLFAKGADEALELLRTNPVAVIVTDQKMPGKTGLELLAEARAVRPDTVNMLVTGWADVPTLAKAINDGLIYRYIGKPWSSDEVGLALRGAVERVHLLRENARLVDQLSRVNTYLTDETNAPFNFGEIVGESEPLKKVLSQVERVAATDSTVLIFGETGTGKELLARAVHLSSPRSEGAFVKVNCAALSPTLLESELFGHEKGAFTGAVARKVGRFELANGGTLFLDEVGDLPADVQVKLLRVLQEREFERVGGTETVKVDLRLVAATHRNVEQMVGAGTFREDLYYRLNVFPVTMPPLRDRGDDVLAIARHFATRQARKLGRKFQGFDAAATEKLRAYRWPGNVRELENTVERASILSEDGTLRGDDLQLRATPSPSASASTGTPPPSTGAPSVDSGKLSDELDALERNRLAAALEKHKGRKSDVARELGVNRSTLYYRLKKFGFE